MQIQGVNLMRVSRVSAVSTVALLIGVASAAPVWAQTSDTDRAEESRQETVIVTGTTGSFGATKNETPIVETARSLSVETSDMFIDKGALRLVDTLTYVAGVTAEPYGFSTRGDFPFSRGLSIPRYRDSIQELFGSYNSTRADVYTIEQVEVLKGPASVLYGQGSPGGIIPVEGTLNPLSSSGGYLNNNVYAGEPGFNRYNTDSQQITLLGEHRINDVFKLEGTALWRSGEADYQQAWPVFYGPRYLNQILDATPALQAAADLQGLTFTDTTVPRTFYQGDNTFDQMAGDLRLRAEFATGKFDHHVLAGMQYQDVETDSDSAYYFGGGVLAGDFRYVLDLANPVYGNYPDQATFDAIYSDTPASNVEDFGIYLSDQISYENWRFTLGLRSDSVENDSGTTVQDDDAISTSVGVLYRFDNGFAPYASYSESFETVVGTDTLTNNPLKPQEARQYEVGIKYEPEALPGLITFNYFDIEISNLSNPNSLPGAASQQEGVGKLKGFEFESHVQIDEVYLQASISTLDAEDPNGFQLAAAPETQASLWTTWRPDGRWSGFKSGAGIRYVGETVSENGTVRYVTPDYTLGDLMVGYEWDTWDFQVNARNLTDEDYLTGCLTRGDCFPGQRRTVVASLRYKF
jgi:iron complex outermembrane receptor protein